jgi:GntR family transcriptional regulator
MSVDHEGDEYVYVQLASILRERIRSGDLPPGRALPSARLLSQQYEVAIGTVKKAIELLRAEGLVRTVIGRGIFVSRPDGQLRPADHGSSCPDLRHGRSERNRGSRSRRVSASTIARPASRRWSSLPWLRAVDPALWSRAAREPALGRPRRRGCQRECRRRQGCG